ncbi:MAG: hypothetical protein AAF960_26980 [Bacteroidota bacterium]
MKSFIKLFLLPFCCFVLFATNSLAQKKDLPCLNKEFNVVANIVITEGDSLGLNVDSLFAVMGRVNDLFAPICMSFNICQLDTIENYQYDSVKVYEWDEMQVIYHQQRKINMFWVSQFDFEDELCGIAELGGIANTENGGLLMLKGECLNEFAIAHELGRFFGVPYTFGEGEERTEELVRGENCAETGDNICDTPADPYKIGDEVSVYVNAEMNCRFINNARDNASDWYTPHVGNIMSYYPDVCKCDFSDDQYRLMVRTYEATNPKIY